MSAMGEWRDERAATSTVGIVLIVAITVILGGVIGVFAFGAVDNLGKKPTFASLGLTFEEEPVSEPNYDEFRWEVELTNRGGETVDADEIVIYLDHGNQRVTGTLNRSLRAGETVELTIVHNNQDGNTIPGDVRCDDVNVACRLAGDEANYPDDEQIRLQMIHEPSGSILYQEQISISGEYGIFNGNPGDITITNETLTFA
jgi:FlaG/FlaF family flagellin (archaellin)